MSVGLLSAYEIAFYKSINPLQDKIRSTQKENRKIITVVKNLALIPCSLVGAIVDVAIGIFASLAAFFDTDYYVFASKQLNSSRLILTMPYMHLLSAINPNLRCTRSTACYEEKEKDYDKNVDIDGMAAMVVNKLIEPIAIACRNPKKTWLTRNITSRLTYALLGISLIIARTIDLIIGVVAATIALLTAGSYRKWNQAAYKGLLFPSIIHDLFHCTIKIIHPSAGIETSLTQV